MKIKEVWNNFTKWVSKQFQALDTVTKKMIPIVIDAVEGVKWVIENPNCDILLEIFKKAIPGTADDIIFDKVHNAIHIWVPMVLLKLKSIDEISKIEDLNEKLKAALNELKFSSDEVKTIFWKGISALLLDKVTGQKVQLDDCYDLVKDYYNAYYKGK